MDYGSVPDALYLLDSLPGSPSGMDYLVRWDALPNVYDELTCHLVTFLYYSMVLMATVWRFILATSMYFKPIEFRWYRARGPLPWAYPRMLSWAVYSGWRLRRLGETTEVSGLERCYEYKQDSGIRHTRRWVLTMQFLMRLEQFSCLTSKQRDNIFLHDLLFSVFQNEYGQSLSKRFLGTRELRPFWLSL